MKTVRVPEGFLSCGSTWDGATLVRFETAEQARAFKINILAAAQQEDQREQQSNTYCPHGVPHRYPCEECDKQFSDHTICAEEQKLLDEHAACFSEPTDAERLADYLHTQINVDIHGIAQVPIHILRECIDALRAKGKT
ncbi:hypothetical protein UFOVP1095_20 [uncultured Caudovirales phage]|uniref:Uncharacterized protein n=1 Tax=uncultured Caudovirales phage TaxID=2100421 RepID=A0A6J5SHJ6_9CAUD|nr:hypothetical protein UFOVP918_20 [uncultured Caudovirales phage]CAB4182423.1 hypothetical protein UFOVP1095_20 [uncultured Caudovirales phage]CAB4214017.1 hypothetical protein UFOVP1452_20 [uncultured Caudovirales phage]CAB5228434.1 hypothetical protein UFOVP1540_49 [uncultured Caudovirales phage]